MFIHSAVLTARPGKQQLARAQIVEARAIIEGATGRPTSAWMAVTGQPVGTFAVSTRVDSLADLIDGHAKLGASVEYAGLADAAADIWSGPTESGFQRIIGSAGEGEHPSVLSMTTATIAGSFGDAIAFGHEVMEHVTGAVGSPGMLMLSESPDIGKLTWVFVNATPEEVAEADATLQGDTTYLAMYDRAQDLFMPGQTTRSTSVRLA